MNQDYDLDQGSLTEEEYGGGSELPITDYLVYGLLSFWMYTVWKFHAELSYHFESRLKYFKSFLNDKDILPEDQKALDSLSQNGFPVNLKIKYLCLFLYFLSMASIMGQATAANLEFRNYISKEVFNNFTVYGLSIGAVSFCSATLIFFSWAGKIIKSHEYHELLFAKYISDRQTIKLIKPSNNFTKRWNRNQTHTVFFLILCIPLTFSPLFAIRHCYQLLETGADFDSIRQAVMIGYGLLTVCVIIFHCYGTSTLIGMYNAHLRIEIGNQQVLQKDNPWVSGGAASVLQNDKLDQEKKSGGSDQLIPSRILAAIMLTDIVGYSKAMDKDEEHTYNILQNHNKIMRQIIARYSGDEIKTIGDAFLVRFASAGDAVRAARDIQAQFRDFNKGKTEKEQVWVRIGVHMGDIMVMDNDVFGTGVNIAARIEPLAEPGGICISADVYNVIKKSIDVKAINLGKKELKNISDAPEIYKLLFE
jgi:class 3 adenylate cyclase